jgi:hypothetical protein
VHNLLGAMQTRSFIYYWLQTASKKTDSHLIVRLMHDAIALVYDSFTRTRSTSTVPSMCQSTPWRHTAVEVNTCEVNSAALQRSECSALPVVCYLWGKTTKHLPNMFTNCRLIGSTKFIYFHVATAPSGPRFLVVEASRWHSDKHSVGLLWTGDQPDAETTWQHTTCTTDRHPRP